MPNGPTVDYRLRITCSQCALKVRKYSETRMRSRCTPPKLSPPKTLPSKK